MYSWKLLNVGKVWLTQEGVGDVDEGWGELKLSDELADELEDGHQWLLLSTSQRAMDAFPPAHHPEKS